MWEPKVRPIPRVATRSISHRLSPPRFLAGIFDDVWAGVATDFGADRNTIEMGRIRLATLILELAPDGQLGPDQITRTANRLIRQRLPRN